MRIIGGKYKSTIVKAPKSIKARPTTDFAKEGLFNILENRLNFEGKKVLDLFTGTGNISYEFASRGADSILAIDQSFATYKFVNTFAKEKAMPIRVVKKDVFRFLNLCEDQFDIIFADPPYDLKEIDAIPSLVSENNLLTKDGLLIVEHGKETDLSSVIHFGETRKYSRVNFSFFYP